MPVDGFIDWQPGQPALSDVQHAGNLRAIVARLDALLALDGNEAITSAPQSVDGRTVTLKTATGRSFPFTLPPGPFNPAGPRTVGKRYEVDDLITWLGGSYVVLLPHVATTSLADDLAARKIQVVAEKGRDAEVQRGVYQPGQAYSTGDVVYVGTPGLETVYYKAFQDIPVDGPAPPSFAWGQIGLSPYVEFTHDADGKPGAGAVLRRYSVPRTSYILPGLTRSSATLEVAAAAASTYSIRVNGAEVATFTFAAGSKIATFTLAATTFMLKNDRLSIVAPATQDANAAGLAVTLTLNR